MSRAFVSESEWADEPELPPLKSPLPPGARNYMTAAGARELESEIQNLSQVDRPAAADAVARVHGSEGETSKSELRAAQHELALIDRTLEYLRGLMRSAEVLTPPAGRAERVAFGATVGVRDKMTQVEESYTIVGVYESDPERGVISWISPVAKALKGKSVGEIVEIVLPDGVRVVKIVSIVNE